LEVLTQRLASREAEALAAKAQTVADFKVVAARVASGGEDYLEATTDAVRSRLGRGIVLLAANTDGRARYTMGVTPDLVAAGYKAGQLLREATERSAAGKGGGRPEFAQGGGQDPARIDA